MKKVRKGMLNECITLEDVRGWFCGKLWNWLGCQLEVDERVKRIREDLAEYHRQAVKKEKRVLRDIISGLVSVRVERTPYYDDIHCTVSINQGLLLSDLTLREEAARYVAEEATRKLMRLHVL
jgi:hypothetical protein